MTLEWVGVIRNMPSNHTHAWVCLDMAQSFFVHFTHAFTSLSPHLQLKSHPGCCHSPATPLPLFYTPAMPLPLRALASPPSKKCKWLVVVCVCIRSLVYGYCAAPSHTNSTFLPSPQTHWEATTALPWLQNQERQNQWWVSLILSFTPPPYIKYFTI